MNISELENKIINADCIDILKKLPDKCADLVLTVQINSIRIDMKNQCVCSNP